MSIFRPVSLEQNQLEAMKLLFAVVDLLDKHNVVYHLEGGTLLGIVRDGGLLPWDYDLDISISAEELESFQRAIQTLSFFKYRITEKFFDQDRYAFKAGNKRIFKIKHRWSVVLRELISMFRRERLKSLVLDVFVKYEDDGFVYWQAKKRVMRVPAIHYESYEELEFGGRKLKVPNNYTDYLELKYGDWKTPVKVWDCKRDEKTIIE